MTGLATMLRALGVKFEEHHIRMIEQIIPQVPAKVNEIINSYVIARQEVYNRVSELESRMEILREQNVLILKQLENINESIRNWELQRPGTSGSDGADNGATAGRHNRNTRKSTAGNGAAV
jgi:hypothetical protein